MELELFVNLPEDLILDLADEIRSRDSFNHKSLLQEINYLTREVPVSSIRRNA